MSTSWKHDEMPEMKSSTAMPMRPCVLASRLLLPSGLQLGNIVVPLIQGPPPEKPRLQTHLGPFSMLPFVQPASPWAL